MSWIQKLYETYNNCQSMIGLLENENEVPLLPICHTTQKAQIQITIDEEGNFIRAKVIPKDEARTIIQCTEASGGRTSGEAPHPLCDKLQYIAKDYPLHGGRKDPYFSSYETQLAKWCSSHYSHPKAKAILKYVSKGNVIRDLINYGILITDEREILLDEWTKKENSDVPQIFKITATQDEAFIRWEVELPGEPETKVWRDASLWKNWIDFYSNTKEEKNLCHVTGEIDFSADQHPAKIRNDGDKAKIISSNDTSGFTFRGHFLTADQAASVGLVASQKAHAALRWLISRQGYRRGDHAIVAWATSGVSIPKPTDDPLSILGFEDLKTEETNSISTAQNVALKLKNKIAGYGKDIGDTTNIVVLCLYSSTPGRLSITYYRELTGSDFLRRIDDWHETCVWLHKYGYIEFTNKESGKTSKKYLPFIGAPAPSDIAEATYGSRLDDKLRKVIIERILPCIIDSQPLPRDLVESVVRRASNRIGIKDPDDKNENDWNKTLSIACALFNKYNRKENYSMSLDLDRKTRDYLYGRLLALADSLEEWALNEAGEDRPTNAARLMQRFSEHPYTTWRTIELALIPYKARLGGISKKRQRMIDEVIASFKEEDFLSDKKLSGEFLLGYHSQREYLRPQTDSKNDSDGTEK